MADVVGFSGAIIFDATKPDGTLRKLLDTSKLTSLGWRPRIELREGLASTYDSFKRTLPNNSQRLLAS